MKPAHLLFSLFAIVLFACGTAEKPELKPKVIKTGPLDTNSVLDTTTVVKDDNEMALAENLLKEESLGGFKIGMPFRGVLKGWTKAPKVLWEGDGLIHQSYMNAATTDEINLCSNDSALTNAVVSSVTAGPLSQYRTARNIGIGSAYADVFKAYKNDINSSETNDTLIVAGSVYGGLIFNFEKGRVTHIFMGAAAE